MTQFLQQLESHRPDLIIDISKSCTQQDVMLAEDIVSVVLFRYFVLGEDYYNSLKKPYVALLVSCKNKFKDHLKKRRIETTELVIGVNDYIEENSSFGEELENNDMFEQCIYVLNSSGLDPRSSQIFLMIQLKMNYKEIAKVLGVKVGVVRRRTEKAIKYLREYFQNNS